MLILGSRGYQYLTPAVPGYEGSTGQIARIYEFCAVFYTRKWFFREFFGKCVIGYPERGGSGRYIRF
jgi:hypothetical protein